MGIGIDKAIIVENYLQATIYKMTDHYFEHSLAKIHYYKFGNGSKSMLSFHGYGMHGKQFKVLESVLGDDYTFYGFDLFFHKETRLVDQSIENVKKGITKKQFSDLIQAFCNYENIDRFSVIGYSMGTFYATTVVEELANRIAEFILISPSSIRPGNVIKFLSLNKIGNRFLERLTSSNKGLLRLLSLLRRVKVVDDIGYNILYKEIATPELRFSFYACLTFLRFWNTNEAHLVDVLNKNSIKSIFIFGKRDPMYPQHIADHLIPKIKDATKLVLDENHEMINHNFATELARLLK
ncbi:MAG: Alpha/beta hydrolase family protein [Sphingobacteriales bacterium]|nr:Alpha/beta hydrolase family protein [Sphingobacteriales bacterium]